jgi:hypothetical protein
MWSNNNQEDKYKEKGDIISTNPSRDLSIAQRTLSIRYGKLFIVPSCDSPFPMSHSQWTDFAINNELHSH